MPVRLIKQINLGVCGAACAQMVINSRDLVGTSRDAQLEIWDQIKRLTRGKPTLPRGARDSSFCDKGGDFPNKICDACSRRRECWCSHPLALSRTLKRYLRQFDFRPLGYRDQNQATARAEACLAFGLPPVVLVRRANHWVVVKAINRQRKYAVIVLNPQLNAQRGIRLKIWNQRYLHAPNCGRFIHRHVVVGASRRIPRRKTG